MYDIDTIRADFPILSREVNGKPLVYLDNGASAQKPQVVIDAITQAYSMEYANVHRGWLSLRTLATGKMKTCAAPSRGFWASRMSTRSFSPRARPRESTWWPMDGQCRAWKPATRSC